MDDDGEFLQLLIETFRVEADEHLASMSAGLLQLEQAAPDTPVRDIVETTFRDAHSLKGAARAVEFSAVEGVCQAAESVLAALRRGVLAPGPQNLPVLMAAVDHVHLLLGAAAEGRLEAGQAELELITRLEAAARGELPPARPAPLVPAPDETTCAPAPEAAGIPAAAAAPAGAESAAPAPVPPRASSRPQQGAPVAARPDTMRVSAAKLDHLMLLAEELLSVRLTGRRRSADAKAVAASFAGWRREWAKVSLDVARARRASGDGAGGGLDGRTVTRLLEFLGWNEAFVAGSARAVADQAAALDEDQHAFSALADELLEETKRTLMQPFGVLAPVLRKAVHDLARDEGKEIALEIHGEAIEIDRRIVERIKEPLLHLARNSIDHGLEMPTAREAAGKPARGSLRIAASQLAGNVVCIEVSDDGVGMDAEGLAERAVQAGVLAEDAVRELDDEARLRLALVSAVSTSRSVTAISGRGLGLAIVKEAADGLGGNLSVASAPGRGTTFRLVLPAVLTTFRGVIVEIQGRRLVVPTSDVQRVTRVRREDLRPIGGHQATTLDDEPLAVVSLARSLGGYVAGAGRAPGPASPYVTLVVAGREDQRTAFAVDAVLGEQEVLVKPLGPQLVRLRCVSAATVLGDGAVVPILNLPELLAGMDEPGGVAAAPLPEAPEEALAERQLSVVVADDSITSRTLLRSILQAAGHEVVTAVDGVEALVALRGAHFDILVSDVEMPRLNGFELTAAVRADQALRDLPVILVTSLASREDQERGIEAGANAYITKGGFDQTTLLEAIGRLA